MSEQRLIDENVLLQKLSKMIDYCKTDSKVNGLTALFQVGDAIMDCPTVDAVPRKVFDQIKWERDIALGQLEKLGISLGQEIDGVYLTKEEHEKLLEYMWMYKDLCQ